MNLKRLDVPLSVCRLDSAQRLDLSGPLRFIAITDEEISLVCPTEGAPDDALAREDGWRAIRVEGELDFSLVGVLAALSRALAEAGIPLFAVSTYNTDYLLVKREHLPRAEQALTEAGHMIK